jgi:LacI family transcriptional regulator
LGKRPTIRTLAERAGVSIATVSKALANSPVVTEATRNRIAALAEEIGYVPSLRGVALRTGRTFQAAVLMPMPSVADEEWEGVEYTHILSGLSRAFNGTPYHLAVHPVHGPEEMHVLRQIVERRSADGVVFSGTQPNDPRITYLLERGFPFAVMGQSAHAAAFAYVDIDSERLGYESTARLLALGHTRILLINPEPGLMYGAQRLAGYRRALKEAKLGFDAGLVRAGRLSAAFGQEAALTAQTLAEPPSAYLCLNEATALGVMSGLRAAGKEPARDAVVVGYDDINVSAYFSPAITTYYQPIDEMSTLLGQFLLRRIDGEPAAALQQVFMPRLIERQSDRISDTITKASAKDASSKAGKP